MKKQVCLFIILLCLYSVLAKSQEDAKDVNFIPPSPNARSLLKFGEYPVSEHTGVPNISIPIHTIELKNISFPISISYNASGIKVAEEATEIGLGWNLNAGGVISHTLMGLYNDFEGNYYFNNDKAGASFTNLADLTYIYSFENITIGNTHFPQYAVGFYDGKLSFNTTGMSSTDVYRGAGTEDAECANIDFAPDVFNYNFLGFSGKFIFNRKKELVKEKEDNIKFSYTLKYGNYGDITSFTAIAPDGNKYFFNQIERTNTGLQRTSYNSSFYLTGIETLGGSKINISYKKHTHTYREFVRNDDIGSGPTVFHNTRTYDIINIDQITYPNGHIQFDYSFDREDLKASPKLKRININEGGLQQKWELQHAYFTSNVVKYENPKVEDIEFQTTIPYFDNDWNQKRLKLTEIKQIAGNESYSYQFKYNEQALPTKLSTSMDHWGYYNGAMNYSLIPTVSHNISMKPSTTDVVVNGYNANREPSASDNQAFILNEIVYPTGGKTQFTYEGNWYRADNFENDPYKKDYMYEGWIKGENISLSAHQNQGANNIPHLLQKTAVDGKISLWVSTKIQLDKQLYNRQGNIPKRELILTLRNTDTNTIKYTYNFYMYLPSEVTNDQVIDVYLSDIILESGKYEFKVEGGLFAYIKSIEIKGEQKSLENAKLLLKTKDIGGGIRVKGIKSFDTNNNILLSKEYRYTTDGSRDDNKSSGKLMFYPRYRRDCIKWVPTAATYPHGINYVLASEMKTTSYGLRGEGYSVGYSKVYVLDCDQYGNSLGQTVNSYINIPDKNLFYSGITGIAGNNTNNPTEILKDDNPSGLLPYKYSENGTLLLQEVYDNKNNKKKSISYQYDEISADHLIIWGGIKTKFLSADFYQGGCLDDFGWKTYWEKILTESGRANSRFITSMHLYPALRPIRVNLLEKKEITYYDDGNTSEQITKYKFNRTFNYLQEETVLLENNEFLKKEYTYPIDLMFDNNVMKQLTEQNRISDPVKMSVFRNGKLIKQDEREFAMYLDKIQLSQIKIRNQNGTLEPRVKYHSYNSYGNPTEVSKDDNIYITYLWSYKGEYPIAEIRGVRYSQIVQIIGENYIKSLTDKLSPDASDIEKINNLRLNISLKDALVTTYTYRPLVGMLTSTDASGITTYYNYDSFGRLNESYIMENGVKKILQGYTYHYVNK